MENSKKLTLREQANNFVFNWHKFPLDYWWRKKYGVAFGSTAHRSMNFIDMFIEYQETLIITKQMSKLDDLQHGMDMDDDEVRESRKTVDMSQKEIDADYEEFDLENFDKK